ncbi:hypothetical protein O6H91_06G135900 [Diphasiastrum complanatum]|uniref:Uncharacterized protein n=1 Tax=Diphasiastrum complanatum TaxID=34168 RepID=A0ACC2DK25_DIPCM|nr:hypothetical protein O6H91_06G135900 [Diphasiastrum complanatum]
MNSMNATSTYKFQTNMSEHMESAVPSSSSLWTWMKDTQFSENSLSEWSNPTQTQGSSITCSSISDIEGAEWPPSTHVAASICSASDVSEQLKELAADLGQEVFTSSNGVVESDQSSVGVLGGTATSISWGSLLLGVGGTEALQTLESSSLEGFTNALYSRPSNQVGNLTELSVRKSEELLPAWDFSEKNLGLEESDVNLASGQAQYSLGQNEHLTGKLLDIEAWSNMDQSQRALTGGLPIQDFSLSALDFSIPSRTHQGSPKIKQETDIYYNSSSMGNSSLSLHSLGSEAYRGSNMTNFLGQPFRSNLSSRETGSPRYPVSSNEIPRRWVTDSSRFPAMLSQLLPGSSAKHGNSHGGSTSRSYLDYTNNVRLDHQQKFSRRSDYSCFTEASLAQHAQHEVKLEPRSTLSRRNMGHIMDESRELVLDSARSTCSLSTCELTTQTYFKRPRLQQTANLPFKPRKEKLSERITALQQLVAPFGKTDTASVLTEAIAHIRCMHDKVQLLSKPYLKNSGAPTRHLDAARSSWNSDKAKDEEHRQDLRSRGLCLVPLSWTLQVASDNVTEYWAPMHLEGGPR